MMAIYEPTAWTRENAAFPCKGLAGIVSEARKLGYRAFVDFGEGVADLEEVTHRTVRFAVHEMDETILLFIDHDGYRVGWIHVIPSNDEDWLCDHTVSDWLTSLVEEYVA